MGTYLQIVVRLQNKKGLGLSILLVAIHGMHTIGTSFWSTCSVVR